MGSAHMNCLDLTTLTIFQLSKTSWKLYVLSGSIVSWEDCVWVSYLGPTDRWVFGVSLIFRTIHAGCGFGWS